MKAKMKEPKRKRAIRPRWFVTGEMTGAGVDAFRDASYAKIAQMCEDPELNRELNLATIRIFEILKRKLKEEVGEEPLPPGFGKN